MTKKKTVEILKELWRYERTDKYSDKEIRGALEYAVELLEKQFPKKPIREIEGNRINCPHCGVAVSSYHSAAYDGKSKFEFMFHYDFCPSCGQSINWSDCSD